MVEVNRHGKMEVATKDITMKEKNKAGGKIEWQMEIYTKVFGKTTNIMVKEDFK